MNNEKMQQVRHSCAHLLAAAVLDLYPGAHNAIGPAIQDGFYQDFDFGELTISDQDLPKIEKRMKNLVQHWGPFEVEEVSVEKARADFAHNPYKLELIEDLAAAGEAITENNPGNFLDLCRGGHSEHPKDEMKYFKLLRVAGAYWRGDEKNTMLTRIYGVCFATQEELDAHITMLEEARKRDHRKVGKELDLFTFSELVGPGLPLWTPRGTLVRNILEDYVWSLRSGYGYEKVEIPHITKKDLYIASGHWDKFADELFRITTREGHEFAMKPMNCPHHTQIFDRRPFSYREMPQRYANTTMCYRDEQTGELHGLSRVRSFTQDDAHVFCREEHIKEEMRNIWNIIESFYAAVGLGALRIRLSLHDPENFDAYLGTKEQWESMENAMRTLIQERGVEDFFEAPGEAAFYGPKIDFITNDSIGREWQVATIQIDKNQPEGFDLTCINEKGENERIVMIHAAIMGSIERFLSIIIEHHAGNFPLWFSPTQVHLIAVGGDHKNYSHQMAEEFRSHGIRVDVDDSDETVGKKIRNATQKKVPYVLVIGDKEMGSDTLSIRKRGERDTIEMIKTDFIAHIQKLVQERSLEI